MPQPQFQPYAIPLTCPSALPSLGQLALGFAGATVAGVGVRQNKLFRRKQASIAPVGRPPHRRRATGVLRHYFDRRASSRQGQCQTSGDERCGCATSVHLAASIAGAGLQPDAACDKKNLVLRPDIVHLARRIISRALCSAHMDRRDGAGPDQRKIIRERRRAACMRRKIVMAAQDQ